MTRKKLDPETQKKIVKLYTEDELTQIEIARKLGIGTDSVAFALHASNVKIDTRRRLR